MHLALAQTLLDSTTGYVSIGVLIVVIGAAWRVSSLLARIDENLKRALGELAILAPVPGNVALLEQRMGRAENDINELWDLNRADPDPPRRRP